MASAKLTRRTLLTGTAAAAAATAAGIALAGCSSGTDQAAAPAGRKPGEKVNLTFWSWVPGIDKAVDLWNSKNPDIQVKLEKIPPAARAATPKMHAALKAGNAARTWRRWSTRRFPASCWRTA